MNTMAFRLDRFDEFVGRPVRFDDETAAALVDAGYVLYPGRFHTRGSSVAPACILAKAAHDGPRLGRPALLPLPAGGGRATDLRAEARRDR